MKYKKIAAILASLMLSITMIAFFCGCAETTDTTDTESAGTQVEAQQSDDVWISAYKQVLEENADAIEAYTWQGDSEEESFLDESYEPRSVSLCDINGDQIPELFFFTADTLGDNYAALLNIYTFSDGKAKRMDYPCLTNYGEITEDGFYDEMVSAGVAYAIVSFADRSGFAIYFSFSYDIAEEGRCAVYEVNGDSIEMTEHLRYEESMLGEYEDGVEQEFFINDELVLGDEFNSVLESLYQNSSELILNSYDYFDPRLWDYISRSDLLAVTYSDAIDALSESVIE